MQSYVCIFIYLLIMLFLWAYAQFMKFYSYIVLYIIEKVLAARYINCDAFVFDE